jgi:peptide/nickel transport system ATP-binding protein
MIQRAHQGGKVLVEAKNLTIEYPGRLGTPAFKAVDGVNFTLSEGEVFGLVGESGSGKTTIGRAIAGLNRTTGGSLKVLGYEMLNLKERTFKPLRKEIGFVFQDPAASFNPQLTIGDCIAEPLIIHTKPTPAQARQRTRELLEAVQLPAAYADRFPHELSGGQRQRVLIAMALSRSPRIVVADEPTTALDVTVQHQVVQLLNELREQLGFAMVFVSHDLALVASLAHRITVMYAGQVVESAQASALLQNRQHEYTRGLLGAVLSIEADAARLHQIPGTVPSPREFAAGDRFAPRSLRHDADPDQQLVLTAVDSAGGEVSDHYWASHLKEDAK